MVVGSEHSIFVQYGLWIIFDSFNVGGLHQAKQAGSPGGEVGPFVLASCNSILSQGIMKPTYPTDLEHFLQLQATDPAYPLVSLFNLEQVDYSQSNTDTITIDQDPSETHNLASKHPELVRELLAEAEEVLHKAPIQVG